MSDPLSIGNGAERLRGFVGDRLRYLSTEHLTYSRDWSRYLLAVNAGGAVAVLFLINTGDLYATSGGARVALGLFALGIVLVGVARACWLRITAFNLYPLVSFMVKLFVTEETNSVADIGRQLSRTRREDRLGKWATWSETIAFVCAAIALVVGTLGVLAG